MKKKVSRFGRGYSRYYHEEYRDAGPGVITTGYTNVGVFVRFDCGVKCRVPFAIVEAEDLAALPEKKGAAFSRLRVQMWFLKEKNIPWKRGAQ